MSDMEVTIKLPEDLVARAQSLGIEMDTLTPDVAALLEREIEREESRLHQQSSFNYGQWWAQVETLQAHLRATYGQDYHVGSLELLRELREEDD